MNTYTIIIVVAIAIFASIIANQVYTVALEGFQTQSPMEKAKKLLSFMEFEGTDNDMILRLTTSGGLRVENGGVTIKNTDDSGTYSGMAGGILFNQEKITKPLMSLPTGSSSVGTTWSLMPDKQGILSTSVTSKNPVAKDGGYVPILGLKRSNTDGSYVVPSM